MAKITNKEAWQRLRHWQELAAGLEAEQTVLEDTHEAKMAAHFQRLDALYAEADQQQLDQGSVEKRQELDHRQGKKRTDYDTDGD